ncbi:Peroxidase [Mycolicibacterium rhodesiae JS60]|nr:Peroxidase [Mycolicibacterium rhodesiae JS60]
MTDFSAPVSSPAETIRKLTTPQGIADPHPLYEVLREHSPVYGLVDYPVGSIPGQDDPVTAWAVLTHEQVTEVLRDPATYSSRDPNQDPVDAPSIVFGRNDPPVHTAERKLANQAFTRQRVNALRPWLEEYIGGLVDSLPVNEDVDVMQALSFGTPSVVMTRFFGTPVADAARYRGWAQAFMLSGEMTPEERFASHMEMAGYFWELAGARREAGTVKGPDSYDFIDALVHAEDDGEQLPLQEILRYCVTVLAGGAETSMYLIGNLLRGMAERPEIAAQVRKDRTRVLPYIQETIRLTGPAQRLFRVTTRETILGGKVIGEGERVAVFFGAANIDPAVFEEPLEFQLDRANSNRHLSFGLGAHYCLGAPLALLTGEVLMNAVLDRFDGVEYVDELPQKQAATLLINGFSRLPLRFARAEVTA